MAVVAVVRNRFTLNPYTGKENLKMRKSFGGRVRLLAVMAFMLFSVVVLGLPNNQPTAEAVTVADFCLDCAQQCWNDANTGENNQAFWECVDGMGDTPAHRDACYNTVVVGYYNSCVTLFCNTTGCSITRKFPRSRPGDN